jgi:hypothetical protein
MEVLMVYDVEVIHTKARSKRQREHADVSIGGIDDPRLQVCDVRLVIPCIISVDGPVTTEVSANTRFEDPFNHTKNFVRATEDCNCVMFDSRFSHRGAANKSGKVMLRMVVTVINSKASREQVEVVNKCL